MMTDPKIQLEQIEDAVTYLKSRIKQPSPRILITQGTGQKFLPDGFIPIDTIPYHKIPHFQTPTVETHNGKFIFGTFNKVSIAILKGRFHYYEGFEPEEIIFPIRVLNQFGCQTLIVTNTAGGLNLNYKPGSLMIITDHINNMGFDPLRGLNIDSLGPRFPDMSQCYTEKLIDLAQHSAKKCCINVHAGVYTGVPGPSLETPAETRLLKDSGADAVGMSTIPEVIAAQHLGMSILGISLIANVNNPEDFQPITLEDVIKQAQKAQNKLKAILSEILTNLT